VPSAPDRYGPLRRRRGHPHRSGTPTCENCRRLTNHTFQDTACIQTDGDTDRGRMARTLFKAGVHCRPTPVDGGAWSPLRFWQDRAEPDRRALDPSCWPRKIQDSSVGLARWSTVASGVLSTGQAVAQLSRSADSCFLPAPARCYLQGRRSKASRAVNVLLRVWVVNVESFRLVRRRVF